MNKRKYRFSTRPPLFLNVSSPRIDNTKNLHEITILWLEIPLSLLQALNMYNINSKLHCVILK